jgi:hypothetical protein
MRKNVKLRIHNVIAKPALQYGSEPRTLREPDKRTEAPEPRFLLALSGISLRAQIGGIDI